MVEQSLSVDNLFVFVLLFDYFKVPAAYQMRVLNWGIIGAVIFRGIFVGLGAATTPAEDAFSAFRNRSAKLYTTKLDITKSQLYNHH